MNKSRYSKFFRLFSLLLLLVLFSWIIDSWLTTGVLVFDVALGLALVLAAARAGALRPRSTLVLETAGPATQALAIDAGDAAQAEVSEDDAGAGTRVVVPGGLTPPVLLIAASLVLAGCGSDDDNKKLHEAVKTFKAQFKA